VIEYTSLVRTETPVEKPVYDYCDDLKVARVDLQGEAQNVWGTGISLTDSGGRNQGEPYPSSRNMPHLPEPSTLFSDRPDRRQ
jgi:hypothetical protein